MDGFKYVEAKCEMPGFDPAGSTVELVVAARFHANQFDLRYNRLPALKEKLLYDDEGQLRGKRVIFDRPDAVFAEATYRTFSDRSHLWRVVVRGRLQHVAAEGLTVPRPPLDADDEASSWHAESLFADGWDKDAAADELTLGA